jgi:hypothetical protein
MAGKMKMGKCRLMRQPLEVKDTQTHVPEWLLGEIVLSYGPKFEQDGQS